MAEERNQRRLAAILAADVVGYSRLMGRDESGTLSAFAEDDMAAFPGRRLKDWDEFWRGAAWYQHQKDHDHLMDGLREAGLPE
ncbi:hypothetical protein [Mesorhizobium sp. M0674]|uniref:hypothetical protein n=1 Tax=unclassified Mesorhizobium TaxID=325217 RepID=UPI0033380CF5